MLEGEAREIRFPKEKISMNFFVVIPARYDSSRFQGNP